LARGQPRLEGSGYRPREGATGPYRVDLHEGIKFDFAPPTDKKLLSWPRNAKRGD